MQFFTLQRMCFLHGVPSELGAQESHHKDSKVAAKLTQRKEATFDCQTGIRMTEFMAIDLAMLEVEDGNVVWEHFVCHAPHNHVIHVS